MKFAVSFDGVKVEVDLAEDDTVGTAIKAALATIFPPESSPPVDGCVATLGGRRVALRERVMGLAVPEGHLLLVTLPF